MIYKLLEIKLWKGVFLLDISDFPQYRYMIIGYFKARISRIKDLNSELLYKEFENEPFIKPDNHPASIDIWLKYQAHIFLMDKLRNRSEIFYNLYIELIYNYCSFYKKAEFEQYKDYYPEQLFFDSELPITSFRTLVSETSYPYRVLCYCYKRLINGWSSLKIVTELSSMKLGDMLELFKKEYMEESGLHRLYIDYMFLPLKQALNKTLNDCIQQYGNDSESFLRIIFNILNVEMKLTKLEDYFGEEIPQKRAHMVSVWCDRVRKALYKRTVEFLYDQRNYVVYEGKADCS